MQTLTLTDGRTLAYDVYGDPDGTPVIFNHGFSDSRIIRNPDASLTASLGVRVIAADQPGVGGSSPKQKRTMLDWGADMQELADHLQLDAFAVAGHSGGGPHALSVAVHMPDRVTHGVLASPVGPLDRHGYTSLIAMKDLRLIVKLHHFHHLLKWAYRAETKQANKDMGHFLEESAKGDPSDAATFLANPDQRDMFIDNFTAGMAQGEEGLYEMTLALWDWGFDIQDVRQHFDVFYGDADDILEPAMPRMVAEQLPDATAHVWQEAGHYGFVDTERWKQFLGAVAAR
ncbi:MAG: alpha/beta hydrolase [Candidatus Nanopelagicales bacterium]